MAKKAKGYWKVIYRSSVTGQLVSEAYAKKHPRTTERERVWVASD